MSTQSGQVPHERLYPFTKEEGREEAVYPVDMSNMLANKQFTLDTSGVPYIQAARQYDPIIITSYALEQWNHYCSTRSDEYVQNFLTQAYWLVEHVTPIGDDAAGWPVFSSPGEQGAADVWLSAIAQGCALSVLLRAYRYTGQGEFLSLTRRVIRTFERDILDGGINTPVSESGICFEEIAAYPAPHSLKGFLFALVSLYDYLALAGDSTINLLLQRGFTTLHTLLVEYDAGFWTRSDLLYRRLSSFADFAIQTNLLATIAYRSGCAHCALLVARWRHAQRGRATRLRYLLKRVLRNCEDGILHWVRKSFFPRSSSPIPVERVSVPVPSHPFTGGILTVLNGVAEVMENVWQVEYLAQYVLPHADTMTIHRFGATKTTPWQFPLVWFYMWAGLWKLLSLQRRGKGYHVILPQDGLYTSAFAALAAKIVGVRVVCMDHASLTWLVSPIYRQERMQALSSRGRMRRLLHRILYALYWPTLPLFARFSAHLVDQYLIPGIAGDEVDAACKRIGIPLSRITRFASMIDVQQHPLLEAEERMIRREQYGIPSEAIVIALICRLAPEKGIDIALESVSQARMVLPADVQAHLRVVVAGDGPLRASLLAEIQQRGLEETVALWGECSSQKVFALLSISDIFLYTSIRGGCFSMSVLEAMAAACAVVASTAPLSNAHLLADGRGIAVAPGDVQQTSQALVRLMNDIPLCQQMGQRARTYVAMHHSPIQFRRVLQRATYWSSRHLFFSAHCEGGGAYENPR